MYTVLRKTVRKRLSRKLQEVKAELRKRMHAPIEKTREVSNADRTPATAVAYTRLRHQLSCVELRPQMTANRFQKTVSQLRREHCELQSPCLAAPCRRLNTLAK